jgi:hypothetical protein
VVGVAGWAAVADALERVTSLTSLNGCDQYAAIRVGGVSSMELEGTGLGVWAARFLDRSALSLTMLDIRCEVGWGGGGGSGVGRGGEERRRDSLFSWRASERESQREPESRREGLVGG